MAVDRKAKDWKITVLDLSIADVGIEWAPGITVKGYSVQCRTAFAVKFGKTQADVEPAFGDFGTIKANGAIDEMTVNIDAPVFWFSSEEAGVKVEILYHI